MLSPSPATLRMRAAPRASRLGRASGNVTRRLPVWFLCHTLFGSAGRRSVAKVATGARGHPRPNSRVTEVAMRRTTDQATEIRPFHVDISDEALEDLRRRVAATNWPEKETVGDQSQGVPLAMIQELASHWATDYDWRTCEAALNALPQFITELDGLDIHFIHVRSQHENT